MTAPATAKVASAVVASPGFNVHDASAAVNGEAGGKVELRYVEREHVQGSVMLWTATAGTAT